VFIVLAHAQPVQFRRLASSLVDHGRVVAHLDARSPIDSFLAPGVDFLADRIVVRWGGFSIVDATLRLLRHAVNDSSCSHVVLLSGDSYPLVAPADAVAHLRSNDDNYINLLPMPAPEVGKDLTRITRYYFEQTPREESLRQRGWWVLNRMVRRNPAPAFRGLTPHCGSQWWALTRDAALWLLAELERRPEFVKFCRHTALPDEHFFHTLLANSPFVDSLRPAVFYADFSGPVQPAILEERHVRMLWDLPDGY
jgi:hypothetical protein